MADVKVSALPVLAAGDLDLVNDMIMVVDVSAGQSKRMPPGELLRAAAPYLVSAFDFTTGALPPTVSFTRASAAWRWNSSGVLVPETTDVPRFQYNPATLTPRGLLIEEAQTNTFTKSEQLDNAIWTKSASSVSANQAVAPDSATTMDKIVEDGTTANHSVRTSLNAISFTSGTVYALSAFVKAGARSWVGFTFGGSTAWGGSKTAYFNLGAGTVGTLAAGVTGYIQNVGGGIYWICAIAAAVGTATGYAGLFLTTADNTASHAGDGVSDVLAWGLSLNTADSLTSYIPTDATTVTRAADVALITNANALADQCWIVKARTPRKISGGAVNVAMQVDDGTSNNRRSLRYETDGSIRVVATTGGSTQCNLDLGSVAPDSDFSVAIRWADNNFAASLNGGALVRDLSGVNPLGLTTARIGRSAVGSYWNSTIRTIETRRTASDAELPLLAA